MVTPSFIIDTMQELDYRYFSVLDSNYNIVYQMFQPVSLDESVKRMKKFLENASSAMYRIHIYPTNEKLKNGEPKSQGFQYEIMLTESLKDDKNSKSSEFNAGQMGGGMNGMGNYVDSLMTNGNSMMGGVGLDRYLGEKDRIMELQLRIQQLEMEKKYLEEKLERRESELKKDFESQMSTENRIQGIINNVLPTFMSGFQQAPMNGVGQTQTNNFIPNMNNAPNTQNPKDKVINAVNKLMQLDDKFPENIDKLAKLCQDKPAIYQMAVQYLNSL
jgi:hypothetical protein